MMRGKRRSNWTHYFRVDWYLRRKLIGCVLNEVSNISTVLLSYLLVESVFIFLFTDLKESGNLILAIAHLLQ